jgi:hypothetical protein
MSFPGIGLLMLITMELFLSILSKYSRSKALHKAAVSALEGLRSDQYKSWKANNRPGQGDAGGIH